VKNERIDKVLVDLDFADSLSKARALVMSGVVLVNEQRILKPSEKVSRDAKIRLKGESAESRYVGRGGLKLEKALNEFDIRPDAYVCLDVGASTGGFTDCLLQHGAKKVVTVDAGTNQLAWKLRNDSRVEVHENVNARFLTPKEFREKFDLIVVDVSFISVTKIFPVFPSLLTEDGKVIILIKPQFEVRKDEVEKGGLVTDKKKHQRVIEEVNSAAIKNDLKVCSIIESPITGMEGNIEFLALYEKA
jgi:23S rRNA (cytidine1920-2'-O)/16S rRNA (cytidine1409-2'-O)-methyltransferase